MRYLNSEPGVRNSDRHRSQWSRARVASRRLGVKWNINGFENASLLVNETEINDKNKVFKTLRGVFRKARGERLRGLPHQGKTASCFSATKAELPLY